MTERRTSTRRRLPKKTAVSKTSEEAEADDEFWGQAAFLEDEDDESFDENEMSDKGEDVVDSDFDDPEDEPAGDEPDAAERQVRREERKSRRKARSSKYVDPAQKAKRSTAQQSEERSLKKPRSAVRPPLSVDRNSLRKSTKQASLAAANERARRALEDEKRRQKKAERDAMRPEQKQLTQEELLEEAKQTEIENRESLKDLLRLEEERKRIPPKREADKGPVMSFKSRDGTQTISFTDANADAKAVLFPQAAEKNEKSKES